MFFVFIAIGILSVVSGYILIFRPNTLIKWSHLGNRLILTDYGYIRHHRFSGIVLIVLGAFLFFTGMNLL